MSDVLSPEVQHDDALSHCLAEARQAQAQSRLDEGLTHAQRAWDLARDLHMLAEQVEAGRLRAFFLYRRGDLNAFLRAAEALLPLLQAQGPSPELGELLRWMTLAGCETGDFETAMRCANEGYAVAQELGDSRLIAVALNALGATFERMGDPWQAERLMTEAAALVREQPSLYERVVTLNNLCHVALGAFHLLRDSGHDAACADALARALRYAQEVRPHAEAFGDPFARVTTEANLGEALLHSGQLEAAEALLVQTLEQARALGYEVQAWILRCSLAELRLLQGEPRQAYEDLHLLLQEAGERAPSGTALRAHHALYRAAQRMGQYEEALKQLELCQRLERRRTAAQRMAQSRFFVTRLEAEQSRQRAEHQEARAATLEAHLELDPLTGLGNRRCMESRMPALLRAAEAAGQVLTLALIDADHFKLINEQLGHTVGDRVLQQLAQMLRDNTRGSDLLLRYGGEEFLVLFPDTVPDRAFEVCERLRQCVESFPWDGIAPGLQVTLSIGLASSPPYATDLLISRADSAMYRAKHLGRNRVALA